MDARENTATNGRKDTKEYYESHKDSIKAAKKRYYEKNKEKIIDTAKQYYADHREKCIARDKIYTQANKEKIAERKRQWRLRKINEQYQKEHIYEEENIKRGEAIQ